MKRGKGFLLGRDYTFHTSTHLIISSHLAKEDLRTRNVDYLIQQQIIKEHFLAEQAKKTKSRRLKRVSTPDDVLYERNKNAKGGID